MFKLEGCYSPETWFSTNKFISKLHGSFLKTLYKSRFMVKQNKKRFLLNSWVSTGFLSFHALIIVLMKAMTLKLLSVHNFPAKVLWKICLLLTSSTADVTPSSSSFDNEIFFHFSMSKHLPTYPKTRHNHFYKEERNQKPFGEETRWTRET